ncbi:MAG: MBOAT family O-acyltransferase [Pseudomonadota bacterium]|nr:MBOAT family O-acyltransferase [Pseudomonadota bacterium]
MITGATDLEFIGWQVAGVALHVLLPRPARPVVAVALTAAFLAVASWTSLVVLLAFTGAMLAAVRLQGRQRDIALLSVVAGIAVALVGFKALAPAPGHVAMDSVLLPLGLSYYSFRCIHVLVEVYLGEIEPPRPADLVRYLFFLPTFVAGPIHRYQPFIAETGERPDLATFARAGERILHGYAQIVILGNWLVSTRLFPALKAGLAVDTAAFQYLECLQRGLNLYFQFAGYSSIAVGLALLHGHQVMENFNRPLLATNIAEFWRRWHMSLSSWCRDYVFTGAYSLTRRIWIGTLSTMLVIGVWHGLTENFAIWGLYHGLGVVIYHQTAHWAWLRPRGGSWLEIPRRVLAWFMTFNYFMLGMVWAKEPSIAHSLDVVLILLKGVGIGA